MPQLDIESPRIVSPIGVSHDVAIRSNLRLMEGIPGSPLTTAVSPIRHISPLSNVNIQLNNEQKSPLEQDRVKSLSRPQSDILGGQLNNSSSFNRLQHGSKSNSPGRCSPPALNSHPVKNDHSLQTKTTNKGIINVHAIFNSPKYHPSTSSRDRVCDVFDQKLEVRFPKETAPLISDVSYVGAPAIGSGPAVSTYPPSLYSAEPVSESVRLSSPLRGRISCTSTSNVGGKGSGQEGNTSGPETKNTSGHEFKGPNPRSPVSKHPLDQNLVSHDYYRSVGLELVPPVSYIGLTNSSPRLHKSAAYSTHIARNIGVSPPLPNSIPNMIDTRSRRSNYEMGLQNISNFDAQYNLVNAANPSCHIFRPSYSVHLATDVEETVSTRFPILQNPVSRISSIRRRFFRENLEQNNQRVDDDDDDHDNDDDYHDGNYTSRGRHTVTKARTSGISKPYLSSRHQFFEDVYDTLGARGRDPDHSDKRIRQDERVSRKSMSGLHREGKEKHWMPVDWFGSSKEIGNRKSFVTNQSSANQDDLLQRKSRKSAIKKKSQVEFTTDTDFLNKSRTSKKSIVDFYVPLEEDSYVQDIDKESDKNKSDNDEEPIRKTTIKYEENHPPSHSIKYNNEDNHPPSHSIKYNNKDNHSIRSNSVKYTDFTRSVTLPQSVNYIPIDALELDEDEDEDSDHLTNLHKSIDTKHANNRDGMLHNETWYDDMRSNRHIFYDTPRDPIEKYNDLISHRHQPTKTTPHVRVPIFLPIQPERLDKHDYRLTHECVHKNGQRKIDLVKEHIDCVSPEYPIGQLPYEINRSYNPPPQTRYLLSYHNIISKGDQPVCTHPYSIPGSARSVVAHDTNIDVSPTYFHENAGTIGLKIRKRGRADDYASNIMRGKEPFQPGGNSNKSTIAPELPSRNASLYNATSLPSSGSSGRRTRSDSRTVAWSLAAAEPKNVSVC